MATHPIPLNVVAVCGSLRPGSTTRAALRYALKGAKDFGADTQLLDLRDYELIFCDGKRPDADLPADVLRLRDELTAADAILLGTPEYHSGVSGVLKNALDLVGFDQFQGKVVGLVGTSGGTLGATNALNNLRTICRSLRAWVIPQQASIPQAYTVFDENGEIIISGFEDRLLEIGKETARFAAMLKAHQSDIFLRYWEEAHANPGA